MSYYAIYKFIHEFIQFLLILIAFLNDQDFLNESSYWLKYLQFNSTVINYFYIPINPLCLICIIRWMFWDLKNMFGEHFDFTDEYPLLEKCNNNQHINEMDKYLYNVDKISNLPPMFQKFIDYYVVKFISIQIIFIPTTVAGVIIGIVFLSLCGLCHHFINKNDAKTIVRVCFNTCVIILVLGMIVNAVFSWIAVYNGHMFVAGIGRAFLAIDQCPDDHDTTNRFENFGQFVVWLYYWII